MLPVPGMIVLIEEDNNQYFYSSIISDIREGVLYNKIWNENSGGYRKEDKNVGDDNKYIFNNEIKTKILDTVPGEYNIYGLRNSTLNLRFYDNNYCAIKLYTENESLDYKHGIYIYENHDTDSEFDYINLKEELNVGEMHEIILNTNKLRVNVEEGSIYFSTDSDFIIDSEETRINSNIINLGLNAEEPIVLGNQLIDWLDTLINELLKAQVATSTGPSTPGYINIAPFNILKNKLQSLLSTQNKTL